MKRHHVNRIFALSVIVRVLLVVGFWIYQTEAKNEPRVVEVEIGGNDDAAFGKGHIFVHPTDVIINGRLGVKAGTGNFQMVVLDKGVGIGTTTPGAQLDVQGGSVRTSNSLEMGTANTIFEGTPLLRINNESDTVVFRSGVAPSDQWFLAFYSDEVGNIRGAEFFGGGGISSNTFLRLNGNVGIGELNPTNILTVQQNSPTDPIADMWTEYSSKRWKTNIKPIGGALSKVQRLRGVSYDWKADGKHDIGLIAEEVGEVIPEIVVYEDNGVDAKSVAYARLVAVLIEAVKEQQQVIERQNSELAAVKAENAKVEQKIAGIESTLQKLEALVAVGENVNQTVIELE